MSVIGAVILNNAALDVARAEGVTAEAFGSAAHAALWRAIEAVAGAGQAVDLVTLRNELDRAGALESIGGVGFISSVAEAVPAASNVAHYARLVMEKARARALYLAAVDAQSRLAAGEPLSQTRDALVAAIERTVQADSGGAGWLREAIKLGLDGPDAESLPWGFDDLDRRTGGIPRGALTVIGAYPSQGKTALTTAVLTRMARAKIPVALFSLEMTGQQISKTILARESGVPVGRLSRNSALGAQELRRVGDALERMDIPFWLDPSSGSSAEIAAKARMLQRKHGIRAIAVDYLQLLRRNEQAKDRRLEIDAHVATLKGLAQSTGLAVIVLSQLARVSGSGRPDENPPPSHQSLKESGAIYEAADLLALLWRPKFRQFSPCGACDGRGATCAECGGVGHVSADNRLDAIISKHRLGEAGYRVPLAWCGRYLQLSSWQGPC